MMGGVDGSGGGRTNLILSEMFDDASSTIIIWMMRCHHYNSQFFLRMVNGVAIGWHDCVQVDRTSLGRGGCVDGAGGWLGRSRAHHDVRSDFIVESTPSSNANKRIAIWVRYLGSAWYYEREVGRKAKVARLAWHCPIAYCIPVRRRRDVENREVAMACMAYGVTCKL